MEYIKTRLQRRRSSDSPNNNRKNPYSESPECSFPSHSSPPKKNNLKKTNTSLLNGYNVVKIVGAGGFGFLALGLKKDLKADEILGSDFENNTIALKLIPKAPMMKNKKTQLQITQELSALRRIGNECPFIIGYKFAYQTPSKVVIGLEYAPGGDLFTLLQSPEFCGDADGSPFIINPRIVRIYAMQLLLALKFLHERAIIYGDLKPENICIAQDGSLRLVDFGMAISLTPKHLNKQNGRQECVFESGTLAYACPQRLLRVPCSHETDYFSLGVLLYEMSFGELPWHDDDPQKMCSLICMSPLPSRPGLHPNTCTEDEFALNSLIEGLLEKRPTRRLGYHGFSSIQNHSFFNAVSWVDVYLKRVTVPAAPQLSNLVDLSHFDGEEYDLSALSVPTTFVVKSVEKTPELQLDHLL